MKICGACGTENDDTRVFCLNCAERLPSSIPGTKSVSATEFIGSSAPKISKLQSPKTPLKIRQSGAGFSTVLFRLLLLLAFTGVGFAIYLIIQPPPQIPQPLSPASVQESSRLANFLRDASKTPGGAWQGDETAINRFLAASVRMSPVKNLLGIKVSYERCFITLREGQMDFTMQVAVYDRSLYLRITLAPSSERSGLGIRVVNASLGQLQVPGFIAQYLLPLWSPCFSSLENMLEILKTADSAEVSPKRLVIRWPVSSSR